MSRHAAPLRPLGSIALLLSAACGGGGGGASARAPAVALAFPSEDVTTDAESITVRGTPGLAPPIDAVRVNGVAAISLDGFATFRAEVPLATGSNDVTVEVDRPGVATATSAFPGRVTRVDPILLHLTDVDFVAARRRLVVVEELSRSVLFLDPGSGRRAVVSDLLHGTGPAFGRPFTLAADSDGDRVFVIDSELEAVVAVDLASGDRTILSDATHGSGPSILFPDAIALDAKNDRVLVVDSGGTGLHGRVVAVKRTTGDRAILSDDTHGSGPVIVSPGRIRVDAAGSRAFLLDLSEQALLSVDLKSGDRIVVSDATHGDGDDFDHPDFLAYDADSDAALVSDFASNAILRVDVKSGDRETFAAAGDGRGPDIAEPRALVVAAGLSEAFVVDDVGPAVVALRLKDAARFRLVAPFAVGAGPSLANASRLAVDPQRRRAYLGAPPLAAVVAIDLATGDRSLFSDATHGAGPPFSFPEALALDAAHGRLLVDDSIDNDLWSVSLANGARTLISSEDIPAGGSQHFTNEVVLDAAHGRVLLVQSDDLITAVDLASGARSDLSLDVGGPFESSSMNGAALDATNDRLLVHDIDLGLLAVALADGSRSLVSSAAATGFSDGIGVALDPAADRILVTRFFRTPTGVEAVDPLFGAVSPVSSGDLPGLGHGPRLDHATTLASDAVTRVAFAYDRSAAALFEVDLTTGDRVIVSR